MYIMLKWKGVVVRKSVLLGLFIAYTFLYTKLLI